MKNNKVNINIKVVDKDSSKKLSAWLQIVNVLNSDENNLKTLEYPIYGERSISLIKGEYIIKAEKGWGYTCKIKEINLKKSITLIFRLKERVNLRNEGYFSAECHNHINYSESIEKLVPFLECKEIDSISLCQGWLTNPHSARAHNGKKLKKFIENASSKDSKIYFGAEFPKTRFGHTCWWKFPQMSDPFSSFNNYHDITYFNIAGITNSKIDSPASEIPYLNEAPIFKVQRWKEEGGVSMMPHPTSWWKTNKNSSLICTNIAVDYCFDLLSERLYDSLVVMGYDSDQIFYQNFWFKLLNKGYRISGVAESDGDMQPAKHQIGNIRTYVQLGSKKFNRKKFLNAICKGNVFVSNGPLIFASINNKYLPGDIIPNNGEEYIINIKVFSSIEADDFISRIVLYKNGRVKEYINLENKKLRHYQHDFKITTTKNIRDWYIVKVYGKNPPIKKDFVDIMKYTKLCEKEEHTEYQRVTKTAFTNPFYFEPKGYKEPLECRPPFRGKIRDKITNKPISGAKIIISRQAEVISKSITDKKGNFSFDSIPLTSEIEIIKNGYPKKVRSIYLHYKPLKRYFEYIYSGEWAMENKNLQSGQVPWKVFNFKKLQKITKNIKWEFKL